MSPSLPRTIPPFSAGGTAPIVRRPPQWRGGVIFASPHSGRDYPDWFLGESVLGLTALRSSEDAYVDELIAPALEAGAVTLAARVPRAIVDVNRAADELDPAAVQGVRPDRVSQRALSGLGVVPRVVGGGRAIRRGKLPLAEARARIDTFWRPYHAALAALMDEAVDRFGRAVLIDVHSMPPAALHHLEAPRPEIVLGDRNGRSAAPEVTQAVAEALRGAGFRLRLNSPFAGAHIAEAYGAPARNRHVVQVEIDRSLYLDEAAIARHGGWAALVARMARVTATATRAVAQLDAAPPRMAAE